MRRLRAFSCAFLALALATSFRATAATTAITNVRVFDGTNLIPGKSVVIIRDGKIEAVGPKAAIPAGATVIDGGDGVLLPGFIDAHTHTWGDALVRALVFGVTTELDMFSDPQAAKTLRAEQKAPGGAPGRADLYSAGILATVPGGHGTEYGLTIPTLTRPAEAQAWVDARIAEGSDYIKIVDEDGSAYGLKIPSLDPATLAALVKAAHQHGKLAVVHVSTAAAAQRDIEAGADGLAHIFTDRAPAPGFAHLLAQRKAFVIPTLTVVESTTGAASGKGLPADLRLKSYLTQDEVTGLQRAFPSHGDLTFALDAVRQLRDAGVPILAGTDAPNPGTAHGASMHRELELLVKAGLTPAEALAAATSVPARIFHLNDRGRIAPGLRADLVLVGGDPLKDITDTRSIVRIWKGGQAFERPLAPAPAQGTASTPAAELPPDGLISDFDDGTAAARFGAGWRDSTDSLRGGASVVHKEVVDGGAEGTAKALEISGEVKQGFAFPWSGALFTPGTQIMAPADLSAARELTFWAQGDGRTYQVLLFASSLGMMPSQKSFVAGPEWKRYTFPLADFPGLDPHGLTGVFLGAGPDLGSFRFRIDGVRLGR